MAATSAWMLANLTIDCCCIQYYPAHERSTALSVTLPWARAFGKTCSWRYCQ